MKRIDFGNGVVCFTGFDGMKAWYLYDKPHRTDGPAYMCFGRKKWFLFGGRIVYKEWWINGVQYSEEEFNIIKEVLWAV